MQLQFLEVEALVVSHEVEAAHAALARLQAEGHGDDLDWLYLSAQLANYERKVTPQVIAQLAEAVRRVSARSNQEDPRTHQIRWAYAESLRLAKRPAEALEFLQQTLRWQRAHLPAHHLRVVQSETRLINLLIELGRIEEALALALATTPRIEAQYGPDSVFTATSRSLLGFALSKSGRMVEAADAYAASLHSYRQSLGRKHMYTLRCEYNLGSALRTIPGKEGSAELRLRSATYGAVEAEGADSPMAFFFRLNLAAHLLENNRAEDALAELAIERTAGGVVNASDFNRSEYARLLSEAHDRSGCSSTVRRESAVDCAFAKDFAARWRSVPP